MTADDIEVEYRPFPELTKEFVAERIQPSWKDLAWAATNHWLDGKALEELADELAEGSDETRAQLATAAAEGDDAVLRALIDQQARRERVADEEVRERWMRIGIAWLYQHRGLFHDPWAVIEEIWEAFGHPPSLNGLIRWMPVSPSGVAGTGGMLERWREFATQSREPV